jgi:hypothetical protein
VVTTVESMTWSLSYLPPREPELLDALFLSAGRSLHLANAFEAKCRYLLRMANLVKVLEDDPVSDLEQAIAALPVDKLLGPTLQDLDRRMLSASSAADVLRRAKDARNFIAHEGAGVGTVWAVHEAPILEHVARLRAEVAHLALGDNVVSQWCHAIEEPRVPRPQDLIDAYPNMIDEWVFGHFGNLTGAVEPHTA